MVTTNIPPLAIIKIALFFWYMNISLVYTKTFSLMQNNYFTGSIKEFWEKNRAAITDRLRAKDSVVALGMYGCALCKTAADIMFLTKSIWQNL